jgi:putative Mn2+ efflux pump MntP
LSTWHFVGDFTLGAALLVIFSTARLSSPQTDRSYTTLFRFFIEAACYSTAYLGVYALLVGFASFAIADLSDISGWTALLILLFSCIPPVSAWDRALRRHVHRMGGIPSEAMNLRDAILHAKCEIGDTEVYYGVLRRGVDLGNMQSLPDHTLHGLLKHASELRYILEQCVQERRFNTFFTDNSRLAHDLKRRFDDLLFKTSRAFAALGELSGMVDRTSGIPDTWDSLGSVVQEEVYTGSTAVLDPAISASRVLLNSLRGEVSAYLSDTALLLARLTLYAGETERGRVALLQSIGIKAQKQVRPRYHVLLTSFGVVLVLLCIGTAMFGAAQSNDGNREVAGTILMVATIFISSQLCAIYPKQYFAFANVDAFGRLPYPFFVVAGLAAAVAAFVIGLAFRMLIYQDAGKALHIAGQRSPWLVVSFTLAVLMAALIQDTDDFATPTARTVHRWRDALVLALGLTAAGVVVVLLLQHTDPQHAPSVWAAGFVGLIGGTLGYMVPHRFRNVCPESHPGMAVTTKLESDESSLEASSDSTADSSPSTRALRSR